MRRHIEDEKVLLFGRENAFFDEILCEALAYVAQLIAQLKRIPRFAT